MPNHFIACVRRAESAQRIANDLLSQGLSHHISPRRSPPEPAKPSGERARSGSVRIFHDNNIEGAQEASVIVLGCQPQQICEVLGQPGMRQALEGKLLISILAGTSGTQIEKAIYGSAVGNGATAERRCQIVRAMPNTAALNRESMTVIVTNTPALPPSVDQLVTWIFTRIGQVVFLPPSAMDAATTLCASSPAYYALMLEAVTDGGVAMGLPRAESQLIAAQAMRGAAGLVIKGKHPAVVKEEIMTPGGSTIAGLLILEMGRLKGIVISAIKEATMRAGQLSIRP